MEHISMNLMQPIVIQIQLIQMIQMDEKIPTIKGREEEKKNSISNKSFRISKKKRENMRIIAKNVSRISLLTLHIVDTCSLVAMNGPEQRSLIFLFLGHLSRIR